MAPDADTTGIEGTIEETDQLVRKIRAELAGRGMAVQASVCAELVATFIAGWARQDRAETLALLVEHIEALVPVFDRQLYGPAGHPSNDGRG